MSIQAIVQAPTAIVQKGLLLLPVIITNQQATIPGVNYQAAPQDISLTDPALLNILLQANPILLIQTHGLPFILLLPNHLMIITSLTSRFSSHRTMSSNSQLMRLYSMPLSRLNPQSPTARVTFQLIKTHGLLPMPQSMSLLPNSTLLAIHGLLPLPQSTPTRQLTNNPKSILGLINQLILLPQGIMVTPIKIFLPSRTTNCTRRLKT